MLWVFYSLLSALSLSTADALSKKGLETADEYTIAWSRFLFSIPYLLIVLLFIRTSLLFSVIYGRLIFKEAGFGERILGSIMMILGVAVISILG